MVWLSDKSWTTSLYDLQTLWLRCQSKSTSKTWILSEIRPFSELNHRTLRRILRISRSRRCHLYTQTRSMKQIWIRPMTVIRVRSHKISNLTSHRTWQNIGITSTNNLNTRRTQWKRPTGKCWRCSWWKGFYLNIAQSLLLKSFIRSVPSYTTINCKSLQTKRSYLGFESS